MGPRRRTWRGFAALLAAGCSVGDIDLNQRECPCASGYVCDSRNVCVLNENLGFDATPDARTAPDGGDGGISDGSGTFDAPGPKNPRDSATEAGPPPVCDGGFDSDPHNCGACGHDCLGGDCANGACQPKLLLSGGYTTSGIAVGGGNVYWPLLPAGGGGMEVVKCSTAGCSQPTVLATATEASTPATDGTNVYWSDFSTGQVLQCAVAGCNSTPLVLATAQPQPGEVAALGSSVFWTTNSGSGTGTVQKCAIGGCNGVPTQLAAGQSVPHFIVVDPARTYWISGFPIASSQIDSCSTSDGGAAGVFASGTPLQVALGPSDAYWTMGSQVLTCPKTGCSGSPSIAATAQGPAGVIAADPSGFYFVADFGGVQILRCPLGGCSGAPVPIVTTTNPIAWVATDATAVYWVESDSETETSQVKMVAK